MPVTNDLCRFIWFQVFWFNTNNFQVDLWDLSGISTMSESWLGNNDNEQVLHTLQSFRTGGITTKGI